MMFLWLCHIFMNKILGEISFLIGGLFYLINMQYN